ncbi:hypothetical protein HPB49_010508 [Dermacentor silvarum]|uniref:Uncharacterized protein n=1 Tax=Dermacentor silvarum TaxID=543639 RepID=A0ACB8CEI2_DERSI|nr:hypothetical protein HPB49_010508 [Dermacentor silvarum]
MLMRWSPDKVVQEHLMHATEIYDAAGGLSTARAIGSTAHVPQVPSALSKQEVSGVTSTALQDHPPPQEELTEAEQMVSSHRHQQNALDASIVQPQESCDVRSFTVSSLAPQESYDVSPSAVPALALQSAGPQPSEHPTAGGPGAGAVVKCRALYKTRSGETMEGSGPSLKGPRRKASKKMGSNLQLKTPDDEASCLKRTTDRCDQRGDAATESKNDPRHHEASDSRRDDMERLRRKRAIVRAAVTRITNDMTTLMQSKPAPSVNGCVFVRAFFCFLEGTCVEMSTPIQCLVSLNDPKKIISICGHTKEDVLAAVMATDFGDVASNCRTEVYNAQFDAYVDPPDGHVFCDGNKIRLISNEAIPRTCRYPRRLYETAAKALILEYPVLKDTIGTGWLHEEFTAVTGVQMEKKLLAFINNYGQKCLDLVKCRRSAKESVRQLEAELQQLEENARKFTAGTDGDISKGAIIKTQCYSSPIKYASHAVTSICIKVNEMGI